MGNEERFPGVLGAFANRINATPEITGEPGSSAFFERKMIDGETYYRLRSEAREAMEEVQILLDTFDHTLCLNCSNRGQKLARQSLNPKATESVVL